MSATSNSFRKVDLTTTWLKVLPRDPARRWLSMYPDADIDHIYYDISGAETEPPYTGFPRPALKFIKESGDLPAAALWIRTQAGTGSVSIDFSGSVEYIEGI